MKVLLAVLKGLNRTADAIHNRGCAIVWSGALEDAESYWESLDNAGLTMAPLEAA